MSRLLLISALLGSAFLADNPPVQDRVQKPAAHVDFTYHSSLEPTQHSKSKLTNFITNNRMDAPLSVEWKKAGILCVGFFQLGSGETDHGSYTGRVIENPARVDSTIKYGVNLQYPAQAQVYVDPNDSADTKVDSATNVSTTEYMRKAVDGSTRFSIAVTSSVSGDSSELSFRIVGGLSLAVPMKLGGELKTRPEILANTRWKIGEVANLAQFGLRDGSYREVATDWLRTNDQVGYLTLFILQNLSKDLNELRVRLPRSRTGRWNLEKIYFLAFNDERSGFVGFAASVYIPA